MKYGSYINLDNSNTTHTILAKAVTPGSKVLDVGCATGYLGEYLHNQLNCEVIGIDYLQEHIKEADKLNVYKELIQLDLNILDKDLDSYKEYFDFILLGDVLEHLYNPQKTINLLKRYANKDSTFIISIPNISHGSIIINLIKNQFKYTPTGLLDDTHIRFFTLNTFVDLLNVENMQLIAIDVSIQSPTDTEQKTSFDGIPKNVIKYLVSNSELFCYQYIFKAKLVTDNNECQNNNKLIVTNFKETINKSTKKLKARYTMHPIVEFIKYPKKTLNKIIKR